MATLPRPFWRTGLLESRWLEISTDLFCFFSFQIIKEVPPPPAEESEVSDQSGVQPDGEGGKVEQRAGWAGPGLRPLKSRAKSGPGPHCIGGRREGSLGSFPNQG